jgi:predicted O-methyltransferase YrrM
LDFAQFDVVFAYLSPAAMPELWKKAQREMRPGSLLISYEFPIEGVEPNLIVCPENQAQHRALCIYDMQKCCQ